MTQPHLIYEQCKNNPFTNLLGNCQRTQEVTKGGKSLLHHQDSVAPKWRASNSSLFFLKTAQLTFLPAPLQYPFKLYPAARCCSLAGSGGIPAGTHLRKAHVLPGPCTPQGERSHQSQTLQSTRCCAAAACHCHWPGQQRCSYKLFC